MFPGTPGASTDEWQQFLATDIDQNGEVSAFELQRMLASLQERFDARESRPEDLKRMQQMEDAVRKREAAVQRAMDEMHYYKLELQNREENYNQLFGIFDGHGAHAGTRAVLCVIFRPFATQQHRR